MELHFCLAEIKNTTPPVTVQCILLTPELYGDDTTPVTCFARRPDKSDQFDVYQVTMSDLSNLRNDE